jgi:hypothetical protein
MKKTLIALAAVAAVAAVPAFAASGADTPAAATAGGKITVNGNGLVESTPDVVQWSFGVTAEADASAAALARVNTAGNKVVAAVRAAGVAQKDIRTEQVSISPQYDQTGKISGKIVASKSVHVTVRSLAQAGKVVDLAVDAGATSVGGPMFDVTEREKLYRQALKAAVAAARVNAQTLADASGLALGRVLEVQEAGGVQPMPAAAESLRAGADAGTQIEPGQASTYASVTVTFATG